VSCGTSLTLAMLLAWRSTAATHLLCALRAQQLTSSESSFQNKSQPGGKQTLPLVEQIEWHPLVAAGQLVPQVDAVLPFRAWFRSCAHVAGENLDCSRRRQTSAFYFGALNAAAIVATKAAIASSMFLI